MKHVSASFLLAILLALPAQAHVGSPDVFLEGNAGPYRLFVSIRVPQVIPGIAQIDIRSESNDVREIRIAPMQLTGPGSQFAPTPDLTRRSATDPQFFTGSLWLMEFGSLQVRVSADGTKGMGELAVPVPAIAQRTLPMNKYLAIGLFALMLLLACALVSIAAAAVREGNLDRDSVVTPGNMRRGRTAIVVAAVIVVALLFVGRQWWNSDARRYARNIYNPPHIQTEIDGNGRLVLHEQAARLPTGNPRRAADAIRFTNLIPDHGHLMHLFLLRTPGMDSFWHVHPESHGGDDFEEVLPHIPPGHYQVFADVVLSSGFPVTMIGETEISSIPDRPTAGDDSGILTKPLTLSGEGMAACPLPDGGRMIWNRPSGPIHSNAPMMFAFKVEDARGAPARGLEPYMGMAAHAEIVKSDGTVFAHIHPAGSISMAALDLAQSGIGVTAGTSTEAAMPGMKMPAEEVDPNISFPYGFPEAGLYRMFVQIKREGQIETGVFDVKVE